MARPTHPRRNEQHRVVAADILHRHASRTGQPIALPVPIDMIVELSFGLTIEWAEIDEPAGYHVLGALSPSTRTIVMNERNLPRFERWVGPERFTLAHELAHWVYDAENPEQGALAFDTRDEVFCRADGTADLDRTSKLREQNANALAAHLLLPDDLVLAHDLDAVLTDVRGTAHGWGVSQQTLRIKLERLGLLDGYAVGELDSLFG